MTLARQFSAFLGVGLASAALDVGATGGLLWLGVHYAVATTVGFALGLLLNFMGHSRISFGATQSAGMAVRFACVVVLNYGLTLALVTAGAHWLNNPMAGKLVSLPMVAIHGFLWGKYWVFK